MIRVAIMAPLGTHDPGGRWPFRRMPRERIGTPGCAMTVEVVTAVPPIGW